MNRSSPRPPPSPPVAPAESSRWRMVALALLSLVTHAGTFGAGFVRDDYLFLQRTRDLGWWAALKPGFSLNAWYRPLSRDLHFRVLHSIFGDSPAGYHVAGALLFLGTLLAFYSLVRALSGGRAAVLASALWITVPAQGLFLTWISSSQDLWMLCLGMLALLCFARGRAAWSVACFAGALLSKETSLLLLPLLWLMGLLTRGERPGAATRRMLPHMLVTAAWAALHPLTPVILRQGHIPGELTGAVFQSGTLPAPLGGFLLGVLSFLRLEFGLQPLSNLGSVPWWNWVGLAGLGLLAGWSVRTRGRAAPVPSGPGLARGSQGFYWAWMGLGILPLLPASAQGHVAYATWGAAGFCALAGTGLARAPRAGAVAGVLTLGLLGAAVRVTPQSDFYTEWSTLREAHAQDHVHGFLRSTLPHPPSGMELYYLRAPEGSGLFAREYGSRLPSLRYWYADSSLRAYLIGAYRKSDHPQRFLWFREAPRPPLWVDPSVPPAGGALDLEDWASGLVRLSRAWVGSGETARARAALDLAARAQPGDPRVQVARARLALATSDLPLLQEAAPRALALAPGDPEARLVGAIERAVSGDFARAEELARAVLASDPGNEEARGILQKLGRAP